jgi:methyltransferase (TIGR00027 family)
MSDERVPRIGVSKDDEGRDLGVPTTPSSLRNVSDTARWVAAYRARETERPEPHFRDPFAARLAGERGHALLEHLASRQRNEWALIIRTILFDDFIRQEIAAGADTVVNLAAGLDARPYRADLQLPPSLRWFEVDLPEMIEYKEEVLRGEAPLCNLERIALDLRDADARRDLFARIAARSRRTLVVSEGLLLYLTTEDVASLSRALAEPPPFQRWLFDLHSPGIIRMMMKQMGDELLAANAPMQFGPPEGPDFFLPLGWRPAEIRSSLREAGLRKLLKFPLSLAWRFPEKKRPGNRPWAGICLMQRV